MTIHLSIVLFAPLALGLLGAVGPKRLAGWLGLAGSLISLAYAVALLFDFDHGKDGLQYVTDDQWIDTLGITYSLGIDGLNLWLIALTTLLFTMTAVWTLVRPVDRPGLWAFLMGLAHTAVLGAFMAQDLILFVAFFDLMLVPFLFLMLAWGGPERRSAVMKMIIYTLVGSLLMLAAAVATGVMTADDGNGAPLSFAIADLVNAPLGEGTQRLLFAGFALAFLIKMPAFPFQGWMPDTYGQLPMPALAVFSAILSKVAAYGFLRIAIPVFPDAALDFQTTIMILSVVGIVYGSVMAFTQTNLRLILGYSSLAQLSFITLGIFSLQAQGAQGAIMLSLGHGLVVMPFFFVVMLAAERSGGSEDIRELGGIAFRGPVLATLALIVAFATLAIPGSASFIGEFYILLGVFDAKLGFAVVAFAGVAMASVYALRAYIRTFHNLKGRRVEGGTDIALRDRLVLVPLVVAILAFGLYPQAALDAGAQAIKAPQPEEQVAVTE